MDVVALQELLATWRTRKSVTSDWLPPTQVNIAAKLGEECGEFIRAVIGELELRPDRGDVQQEAAQIIIVLLVYFGIHYPDVDLMKCVYNEIDRLIGVN